MAVRATLDPARTVIKHSARTPVVMFDSSAPGHEHFPGTWDKVLDASVEVSLPARITVSNRVEFPDVGGEITLTTVADAPYPLKAHQPYPQRKDFVIDIAANERVTIVGTPKVVETTEIYTLVRALLVAVAY